MSTWQDAQQAKFESIACFTRRKLQMPGTAEEHKRQETPTINPNNSQQTDLTHLGPGTIERAAQETRHITLTSTTAVHTSSTATTRHHYLHPTGSSPVPLRKLSPLRSTCGLSRTATQIPPASAGTRDECDKLVKYVSRRGDVYIKVYARKHARTSCSTTQRIDNAVFVDALIVVTEE